MKELGAEEIASILESYLYDPYTRRQPKIAKIILNTNFPEERLADYARQRKYPLVRKNKTKDSRYVEAKLWTDPALARHNQERLSYLVSSIIFNLLN